MRRRDALAFAAALTATPAARAGAATSAAIDPPAGPPSADPAALRRLAARLRALGADGLDPEAYGVPSLALEAADPLLAAAETWHAAQRALADLLLGVLREPPGRPDIRRDPIPLAPWLETLAAAPEPAEWIERAALATPDHAALRAELLRARARMATGPWPQVPNTGTIEPGLTDPARIPALRARLAAEDPAYAQPGGATYDSPLVEAVRRWQAANGLEPDGRLGRVSLAILNRPPEARVAQLRAAMDMRRAAAAPGAALTIEVNIPAYRLVAQQDGREVLGMNVIVGRPDRATPMLRVTMTALQFNPPWGVPMRNAREDLLPRLRRDPTALQARGFRIFRHIDGQLTEIDPTTVDWRAVHPDRFPFIIRQDAGERNALGLIKFVMPNRDDIFMHDTPDRHLFRHADRAFSSGCIRLERPRDLMALLLDGTPGWDVARAERAIASGVTSSISVRRPIPVTLAYRTVSVLGGSVTVRPDLYRLDEAYARAMDRRRDLLARSG
jgi:murein L,D-transpeptidase YcbB/YkuD